VIRKILMVILPLAMLAAGAVATKRIVESRKEPPKEVKEIPPPLVEVMTVKTRGVRLTVLAEGTVKPRTEAELVPEVPGRVIEVSPAMVVGGFFKKGDVLMKIDPREYELVIVRARAAIEQAKLRVAVEQREAELAAREWDSLSNGKAPTDLALRKPYIAEAQAVLTSAEAELARAEYDLERCVVKASFDGRVRSERIDVGQYVSRGNSVATLYSVDAAEIRLPIPDDQIEYVDLPLAYADSEAVGDQKGPRVTIRADFAGKVHTWKGRIVRTEGEIDPKSRMVHAIARVENPYARGNDKRRPPLAVGMFVEAEIEGRGTGPVVDLPRGILRGENTVMVIDDQDRLHFREIDVLRYDGEQVLVRAGLRNGERICTSPLETPVEGMKVRVLDDADDVDSAEVRRVPKGKIRACIASVDGGLVACSKYFLEA
jgi:RND family efflux transporter MFP subunit